ncbi:hypothetical protein CALVIDRAFT_594453 [Calocera viscosa TUFC12733]|uniref:Uncharacterized protein n=1 Tax=Calocera viscosa (strain TUFC12733) TaxID=1330018 RepID=A0A167SBW4_CALVF|nr:hypothetical protein CALVIDRAFT_594453 [Calocera viscosa TUFC12733]
MSQLLATLDKPVAPLATPPPTSNHLNLHFHFEQRQPTKRRSLSIGDFVSRDESRPLPVTGYLSADEAPTAIGFNTLPRGRSTHLRRPSTAPALVQSTINAKSRGSSDRLFLEALSGPVTPVSRASGKTNLYSAAPHPARPSTAPSGDWRFRDHSTLRDRVPPQLSASLGQEGASRLLSPASAAHSLSDSSTDMHAMAHSTDQSSQLRRSVAPLTIAELNPMSSTTRPPHARRMSSLSLGGGAHHIASLGSSMDFGKFMPQTSTTSPRAATFGNAIGKGPSPVDVKRLLTKPATAVGTYSAGGPPRTDDTSGNTLPSPTAPQFASDDPSSARSARQRVQNDSTPQALRARARARTAATHAGNRRSSDFPRGPATSASGNIAAKGAGARAGAEAGAADELSPHTYSSGGEGIGESPQPKQILKRSSSSRPSEGTGKRTSAYIKTDGYVSESSVRLPRVHTALTPAAAIALAYRSQSVAGHREERGGRMLDPKVAPWESDPDLPLPAPPSEWGDLCTPRGFRRLGKKLSMKLSGDEGPPARAEARARTRSFDRPRPRDLPRKPSFDTKHPLPRPTTPSTPRTSDAKTRPRTPDIKSNPRSPTPDAKPQPAEQDKRRPFAQGLGGVLKKLSTGNLRSGKPADAPPVPPLPSPLLREKALLETPKGAKGVHVPPVPPIPIHLSKSSPGSEYPEVPSAGSSTDSFVRFPSAGSPYTPGNTPPHTTSGPKQGKKELPYTLDIHAAPFDAPVPPLRNPLRAKRKPSEKDVGEPDLSKKPEPAPAKRSEPEQNKKSEPAPAEKPERPPKPSKLPQTPAVETVLSEEEKQARRRVLSRSKRDKASKLSISISDPKALGVSVTLQRSPSFTALTPKASAAASPVKTRTHSEGDVSSASVVAPKKSPYSLAQAFPPPRSASLNTPSPSTSSRPSASPQSAHSPPAVAFRTIRSASNKTPLTERQKADMWDELLRRSDEAGGTLQLRATDRAGAGK